MGGKLNYNTKGTQTHIKEQNNFAALKKRKIFYRTHNERRKL